MCTAAVQCPYEPSATRDGQTFSCQIYIITFHGHQGTRGKDKKIIILDIITMVEISDKFLLYDKHVEAGGGEGGVVTTDRAPCQDPRINYLYYTLQSTYLERGQPRTRIEE